VNHSDVAPIEGSCSAIGLHLLIEPVTRPLASWNVVTPLLSVRAVPVTRPARSWKGRYSVSVGVGASSDAAVGVVKDAACPRCRPVLRVGGHSQEQQKRDGGDADHGCASGDGADAAIGAT
jgi:hypothetical protein